jgi:hypothetical protein
MMCAVNVNEEWLNVALDPASHKHIHGGCELLKAFQEQMIETTEELVRLDEIAVSVPA